MGWKNPPKIIKKRNNTTVVVMKTPKTETSNRKVYIPSYVRTKMKQIIKKEGLPDVVFHSLRHTSVTYKLKLSGGDIKAVQGDSGHAQADMVKTGLVTIDGANAFDKVNMWTFPVLKTGETALTFSNTKARVTIRYTPMWI